MFSKKSIYPHYRVVQLHHLLIQLPLQRRLLLVVEQQLIEHNMLDNTKHLHLKVVLVVVVVVVVVAVAVAVVVDDENQLVGLLIVVEFVVLFEPK
jgi:hypothetical protein